MGDSILGVRTDEFCILAATTGVAHSIIQVKDDEDKIVQLDSGKIFALAGECSDRINFADYVGRNLDLYFYKNDVALDSEGTANWIRKEMANSLRSRSPYQVNSLLGGFDEEGGAKLYFLDYLASMHPVRHAAHGYGSYFIGGLLDRHYRKNMSEDDAVGLVHQCIAEVKKRFILNEGSWLIKIVDKSGVRVVPFDASRAEVSN